MRVLASAREQVSPLSAQVLVSLPDQVRVSRQEMEPVLVPVSRQKLARATQKLPLRLSHCRRHRHRRQKELMPQPKLQS
jgi:hypothetical protein